MVVLDILPGLEVWVEVNREPLQEYEDQEDNPDKKTAATRFIAAESGCCFEIGVEATDTKGWKGNGLDLEIKIDGQVTDGWCVSEKEVAEQSAYSISEAVSLTNGKLARYRFSTLDVVNDGLKLNKEAKQLSKIGKIEVAVWNLKDMRECSPMPIRTHKKPKGVGVVSEKALKGQALSHSVEFEEVSEDEDDEDTRPSFSFDRVESVRKPFAKYTFCYRSMEALKSLLIVPRTPSPEPPIPLEERDFTTLSPEELKELQKRFAEIREQQTKIKREHETESEQPRKRARPSAGDTQLEIDAEGGFRQVSTASAGKKKREVIEID